MPNFIISILVIFILSFISYFWGKLVSKIFPLESKFFAGISGIIFLGVLFLLISIATGESMAIFLAEVNIALVAGISLVGSYSGYLSNFDVEIDETEKLNN